jgi:uncharacterized protein
MPSQPEYGIVVAQDVMVPMRDGVRLATDVYRPARDGEPVPGALPAVLGRTSYDKRNDWLWVEQVAEFFTPRGYVVVIQDLRGRGNSEGTGGYRHVVNPHEGEDGYDTVEWLAAQPWCDGRIGAVGSSHGAIVQQLMALHRPPHLAAIWPDAGPINNHAHHIREGGAMKVMMFGAQFLHAQDAQEIRDDPAARKAIEEALAGMRELVHRQPFKPGGTALACVPSLEENFFDYYWRGAYDEFWSQEANDQQRYFERHADVPGVYSGGWYDAFSGATTAYYEAMTATNTTPQRLIMGPWTHYGIFQGYSFSGDVEFGPAAAWGFERYNEERLRFFDRYLKGDENGFEDDPPVLIFVMGGGDGRRTRDGRLRHGGRWRAEHEWPLSRSRQATYHLRSAGRLTLEPPDEDEPPSRYSYDPAHPVPTVAGSIVGYFEIVPLPEGIEPFFADRVPLPVRMRSIVTAGGRHQKEEADVVGARPPYPPLAARPDVLVFQTDHLAEDVEVTGSIDVVLWIASTAVDTDFTAKLIDVYPPSIDHPGGYHLNLVDSILRTRYRNGFEAEELMTPGEAYELALSLPPTSNLFKAGHRIRLDVSSSSFPLYDVNPNTGEPVGRHTRTVAAHQTVFTDRARPSRVVLPVIPAT